MKVISLVALNLDKPEQVVRLSIGAGLLNANYEPTDGPDEYAYISFIEDVNAPDEDVTFYVLENGDTYPDTFPGRYWRTVTTSKGDAHIFFKPKPAPTRSGNDRAPIVVDPNGKNAATRGAK